MGGQTVTIEKHQHLEYQSADLEKSMIHDRNPTPRWWAWGWGYLGWSKRTEHASFLTEKRNDGKSTERCKVGEIIHFFLPSLEALTKD